MRWAFVLVFAALVFVACAASADENQQCRETYTQGQLLRRDGRFKRAAKAFATCQDTCPGSLGADCTRWLEEMRAAAPRLLVVARNERGEDMRGVSLIVDGDKLGRIAGRSLVLDPGEHAIVLESGDGLVERQHLTLVEGETRRLVVVFKTSKRPEPGDTTGGGPPVASWVLAGIGVAALIAGGALALKGRLDLDEYEETCAPICSEEQADGVRRLYVAGGIVAATGGALVITAGIVWAASDGPSAATTGVRVGFDLPMLVW
jgi:hypothetical protein